MGALIHLRKRLVLASNSPRRRQLLTELGFAFETIVREVDEDFPADMAPDEVPVFLAQKKAAAFRNDGDDKLILCADTVVILGNDLLNKPADAAEAMAMLRRLSGRTHRVVTGICLADGLLEHTLSDTTYVTFRELAEAEMDRYITHFRPFDKAGAYGVQEWIGMMGVTRIEGSYYTVVGLPLHRVYDLLKPYFTG